MPGGILWADQMAAAYARGVDHGAGDRKRGVHHLKLRQQQNAETFGGCYAQGYEHGWNTEDRRYDRREIGPHH